jgi:hypothetical protein
MTQAYSDPKREDDDYSLPDIEVFYHDPHPGPEVSYDLRDENGAPMPEGWYWWSCFPGCLPDGDPTGPFSSEDEALADARQDDPSPWE